MVKFRSNAGSVYLEQLDDGYELLANDDKRIINKKKCQKKIGGRAVFSAAGRLFYPLPRQAA